MFQDRSLKIDLCALALLAIAAFLGVSLWTYNATDPPSTIVWPASHIVHNACGRAGALTAHYLFESLAVSVVGLTTLVALTMPNSTPGPIVGAGGYIGAMGRTFLESHFAVAGSYIFALSVLLAGLLLSTDYFLFRAAAVTTSVTGRSLLHVGHLGHVAKRA